MVKGRFPGKPSKYFSRRKVHSVNSEDNEEINAADDVYRRLQVFYSLFQTEDVDNNFHGFSPHEFDRSNYNSCSGTSSNVALTKKKKVHFSLKKHTRIKTKQNTAVSNECSENTQEPLAQEHSPTLKSDEGINNSDSCLGDNKTKPEDNSLSNPTLSGKFVLPTRSNHSSRVIKPNKRFLQGDILTVPYKRSRLNVKESTDNKSQKRTEQPQESNMSTVKCSSNIHHGKIESGFPLSPAKFVLRKPRLKINTQPLSIVGGPFTSPVGNSLGSQGVGQTNRSVTKVFCGVCGSTKTYKLFRQARKFGIFSCDLCRKFILKMISSERRKLLQPLTCNGGSGNCPIRNNSLVTPCFPNDTSGNKINNEERCEACWLKLCLTSFHMPQKLAKRLSSFLPSQFSEKPIVVFNNCHSADWSDVATNGTKCVTTTAHSELRKNSLNSNESRLFRRNKGIRENINIRRGSAASHRLSSHRNRGYRELEESKRGRARQKLLVSGPRIKHVCRSASLVLGQPVATFVSSSNCPEAKAISVSNDTLSEPEKLDDRKSPGGSESDDLHSMPLKNEGTPSETEIQPPSPTSQNEDKDIDYPPVARMLQDLGRANCELLDDMENHESARLNAKVSIDFWESYDPDEVSQMGFPLIGFNPLRLKAVCFLCGSSGLEKMVHCASCCEPYHTFCVPNISPNSSGEWWLLDWLCPKCTTCQACLKTGGSQLSCTECQKSYHSGCISSARHKVSENNWVCPSCLFCKSCNDSSVHVFVGNMPLCKTCFKLRKKGNFCPLCQCCYDDNDFNTKMMECAECKCWIHAQCEGISNEKYQVLSYLPSSIEFICRICCTNPPAPWSVAVNTELKAGYLNVIKILSKNKHACAMFKASPKKQCICVCTDNHRNPIHLPTLISNSETESLSIDSDISTDRDYKSSDFGLLTPKLTKDDEESLITVKSDFLQLASCKDDTKDYMEKTLSKKTEFVSCPKETRLLSIAYDKLPCNPAEFLDKKEISRKNFSSTFDKRLPDSVNKTCSCQTVSDHNTPTLSLLSVKHKATSDEYHSVTEFHKDMEFIMNEINNKELRETYNRCLRQIFPWFNPNESGVPGIYKARKSIVGTKTRKTGNKDSVKTEYSGLKGILNLDKESYYIGLNFQETRACLLCKRIGDALPLREGRLLYCGQNEWVHTNCALWSSEVFEEIDGSLQNVHSAISRARLIRCMHCNKNGASLGCCAKACPAAYHFSCARIAGCVFLENKELFCKTHYDLKGHNEIQKEEDFHIKRSIYVELDHKKMKDILRSRVKIFIGSLEINQIGEILPELSDYPEVVIPCNFQCSRLYWSSKEPWKLVKYSIRTKVYNNTKLYTHESDTNYTIDHSLEITPPPSPVESLATNSFINNELHRKEIMTLITQMIDTVCSREEEGNLSDQQSTDLLPPDLKDAIFQELPQDFLDRISVHDIFTKMSSDDVISESRFDKSGFSGNISNVVPLCKKPKLNDSIKNRQTQAKKIIKVVGSKPITKVKIIKLVESKPITKVKNCEIIIKKEKVNQWKSRSIIQVDGAMDDLSESDQSNDSCDISLNNKVSLNEESTNHNEDKPVKCPRCHRTYRTNVSYEKHLTTCNADFSSCSESDLSEEEKTQGLPDNNTIQQELCVSNTQMIVSNSQTQLFSVPLQINALPSVDHKIQTLVHDNSIVCVNNSEINHFAENTGSVVNINYSTINNEIQSSTFPSEQTLVASVDAIMSDSVVGLQQPTFILQQVSNDNVLPSTFMSPSYQQPHQSNLQYITSINSQEKTHFLATSQLGSNAYHIQSQLTHPTGFQNVPTVVGTIIQPNGVEQLVLNNPGTQSIDVFGNQTNNMYITNNPMLVGMETMVTNTVSSSSRFMSNTTPGMLASSYSATTTQVFQATKPVDISQGYVVLNSNPIVDTNNTCLQNVITNDNITNASWNGYKVSFQDGLKLNKSTTYQTVSHQVVTHKQDGNGIKIINPTDQTILLATLSPFKIQNSVSSGTPGKLNHITRLNSANNLGSLIKHSKTTNAVKTVELPSSSNVHRGKPQQAVAPVVIKNISKTPQIIDINCESKQTHIIKDSIEQKLISSEIKSDKTNENLLQPSHKTDLYVDSNSALDISKSQETNDCGSFNKSSDQVSDKSSTNSYTNPLEPCTDDENLTASTSDCNKTNELIKDEPKLSFEITSDDGFTYTTSNLVEAWNSVFEAVQKSRMSRGLPPLKQNPFSSPDSMFKKLMGLGNNSMKYIIEQLPGISSCAKYKPVYHKKTISTLEKELFSEKSVNPTGSARTEKFKYTRKTYDMFSWLASKHRRPPKLLKPDSDGLKGKSRRTSSSNLPVAMRFRNLKVTSKRSVGVFRSDIHGRGLFCLRDIDSGEMVIEYAGEVIRSALTDKRERYYTEKGIGCYMFRIDENWVVDATMKGNAARFINHSCEPNCYSRVLEILGKKHILIFALRKILQGEELTYDYKFPLEEEKITCHCLSRKCRKYLN